MSKTPNRKNVYIYLERIAEKMVAILDAMLELTVEKISKLLIIYKKRTFAIKTNFAHANFKDIYA